MRSCCHSHAYAKVLKWGGLWESFANFMRFLFEMLHNLSAGLEEADVLAMDRRGLFVSFFRNHTYAGVLVIQNGLTTGRILADCIVKSLGMRRVGQHREIL